MWNHSITYHADHAAYWNAQSFFSDTILTDAGAAAVGASYLTLSWARSTPAGTREDRMTCTFAIGKQPGGNLWSVLTNADKATVEGYFSTWWTSQKAYITPEFELVEYRWHDWRLTDDLLGPADRVTALASFGTGSASQRIPDQDSCTITFETASRKHWGRVYLPGLVFSTLDGTKGRWASGTVDNVATYFHTLLGSLNAGSFDLLVTSRKYRGLLELSLLQVDDIPDIQRRRRPKQKSYAKVFTS